MILRAIEKGVSKGRIAATLNGDVARIRQKRDLLRGVCREAVELLKERSPSPNALREFRRSQNWIGPPGCTLAGATYVPPPPEELMNCLCDWGRSLRDKSLPPLIHAALVLDMLAGNPLVTAKQAATHLGVAFTTAQRGINKLKDALIIEEVGDARRDRVYRAREVLNILEEPTRVTSAGRWRP